MAHRLVLPTLIGASLLVLGCGADADSAPAGEGDVSTQDAEVDATADVGPPPECPERLTLPLDGNVLEVPPHTVSLLIEVAAAPEAVAWVSSVVDAQGNVLVAADWYMGYPVCLACENRIAASEGFAQALVPIAPSIALPAGRWTLEVQPPNAGVIVTAKRAEALPTSGQLRVAFHPAADVPWTAEAESDVLAALSSIYSEVGLVVSSVAGAGTAHSGPVVVPSGLESLAAGVSFEEDALNVVVVSRLDDDSGLHLAGLSPLPAAVAGGYPVVVEWTPVALGRTVAHELGHALGLWHTREGSRVDPLDDTPTTASGNLMELTGTGFGLTEQQGTVMRSHPVVTHSCEALR